ncbi:MAG: iron-sulfur cluster assembly accessory protein [Deltaproteobacteria bacterium]|nr:iron-sulfur cluster assembly accessory protein [Deltaproteobacteria bacterium]
MSTAPQSQVIQLTDSARDHVYRLMQREKKEGSSLRVSVVGGGCSGLSYKMAFEEKPAEADKVLNFNGLQVFVDPRSALFLSGITIDYVDGLNGSGFTYENPNAKRSCGCGTSFSA